MKSSATYDWSWLAALLPSLFSVLLVAVLAESGVIEFHFSIHDLDTFIVLGGLLVTIVLSSIFISREAVRRMQQFSMKQARSESLAEHVRFLRRLDHELKNPLMGLRAALENLAGTEDAALRQQIRVSIDTQVTRLTHLVLDLRKLAELETQPLEQTPIDLKFLLEEALNLALEEIEPNSRQIRVHLASEMSGIFGDSDLLLVAFYNLFNNAMKYTQPSDLIELSTRVTSDAAIIEIRDTGVGIAPEDLPFVWDELFRAERTKSIAGSGIGLALVKRIIERHGGTIHLESQLEVGTTVMLQLPFVRAMTNHP